MNNWRRLEDEAAMLAFGASLGQRFPSGGLITLHGDLGAGKTTLTRGLLRELGHAGNVKSPTYTLVEPYHLQGRDIYHFDLYRLGDPEELEFMGMRDYLRPDALCLVEWPEKAGGWLPEPDLRVHLRHCGTAREVLLELINY
ncbi:tRNA (adenosine(37)-N6)-threonylcarbamoyltransferase complex ATPase subunit type 1 TsaE [Candidatus Thiothrix sp. Deng01]|uniref:tRNA threonylcarbamoyladenosine biosynthesis protein TsaE n=1 Tax=Candidatus Thiothrix phosphatis TaxID=3112415 RepID=A0ABU6D0V4_9GAMM|nr:tRNA (adenosine(37)-N6)-threonylcarbamoyltransferase complex ATPase subunit type 1 TsaE [Candidatus Thiothrix sp. Deng01]MEB4592009.1 tRNA (adenosine(37)-N6)-threonylcarbamoyltransferase complex ATPase subunit type 1 TsaE [Candidatus Thiothrix sp. Deng01]